MSITTNFTCVQPVVDLLAEFNKTAHHHHVVVYIPIGNGRFCFGDSEFEEMDDFYFSFKDTAKDYSLDPDTFDSAITQHSAIFEFRSKHIYGKFMDAMFGKNVPRENLVVQVAGKSNEWHQAAGQYLSYENRARRTDNVKASAATWNYVPTYGKQLVNYVFPDTAMLQKFCQQISDLNFDEAARAMQAASQSEAQRRDLL